MLPEAFNVYTVYAVQVLIIRRRLSLYCVVPTMLAP